MTAAPLFLTSRWLSRPPILSRLLSAPFSAESLQVWKHNEACLARPVKRYGENRLIAA